MRTLFVLLIMLVSSSNILAQSKTLLQSLEWMRNGYIINAITSFETEANKGDVWAQFFLGLCYEKGYGVAQNHNVAFKLYRKTAESGLAIGQHCVAICYRKGVGVLSNIDKAEYWEKKSKNKYDPELLSLIDTYYQEGLTYPQNYALNPGANLNSSSVSNIVGNNVNSNNNTTINITYATPQLVQTPTVLPITTPKEQKPQSDVDMNIPQGLVQNENTFAVIIANENYEEESQVEYALNDGEIFKTYCQNVLGLPETNIHYRENATLNNILAELDWMKQISIAFGNEAKFIFYYAGHGIPDEASGDSYLLPVDGRGNMLATGYSLKKLYDTLGGLTAKSVTVFMDACFSGAVRSGGMMASARGVAIKAKQSAPKGNMIVFSAAQGDETAYPYKEKGHGLFTYHLLKKLQETKGDVTMGELSDYITSEVKKRSIVVNGKLQTPVVTTSNSVTDWRNWKLR